MSLTSYRTAPPRAIRRQKSGIRDQKIETIIVKIIVSVTLPVLTSDP